MYADGSGTGGLSYTQQQLQQFPPREDLELLYLLRGDDSEMEMACETLGNEFGPTNAFRLLTPLKGEIQRVGIPLTSTKGRVPGEMESQPPGHCQYMSKLNMPKQTYQVSKARKDGKL